LNKSEGRQQVLVPDQAPPDQAQPTWKPGSPRRELDTSAEGAVSQVLYAQQGFLPAFARTARRHTRRLRELAAFGIPLVGLDPAMTLVFRQEYAKIEGIQDLPRVLLPQEWLLKLFENEASRAMVEGALPAATAETVSEAGAKQRPAVAKATLDGHRGAAAAPQSYRLLAHCTEKTNEPNSSAQWVKVFGHFGLKLQVQATGCCGMSGTYGHEARNAGTSRVIYSQSWQAQVERPAAAAR